MDSIPPVLLSQFGPAQAKLETLTSLRNPASLPVENATKSFWLDSESDANPLAHEGSIGPLTADADICIIGSGITGVSAAYHLSKLASNGVDGKLLKVVVIEAREFCSGATGRNGGHFTALALQHFRDFAAAYGREEAKKSFQLEHHTIDDILALLKQEKMVDSVDLVSGGSNILLFSQNEQDELKADFDAAKEAGVDLKGVEWLSKEEMKEQYGASYPAVRVPGNNLWPLKLVTTLYNLATRTKSPHFSLSLHTRTPVTSITAFPAPHYSTAGPTETTRPRRWTLHTPRGAIACTSVLHATNAYASHLLPHMAGAGPAGIVPTRGQVLATRAAVPARELSTSGWQGNEGFEYWFPRPVRAGAGGDDERPLVIIGGGRESSGPEFELEVTDDGEVNTAVGATLRRFLPSVFPGKFEEGSEPEMEWTGIMGFTKTGDPFVGPVLDPAASRGGNFKGQYISAGYSGHGMPRGYACAEAVAQLMVHDLVEQNKSWEPPLWLPAHYLTWNRR